MEYDIQFAHLRTEDFWGYIAPKGGVTLAIQIPSNTDLRQLEDGSIQFVKAGIAICHKDDLYNKKIGRSIAKARLLALKWNCVSKTIDEDYDKVIVTLECSNYYIQIVQLANLPPRLHYFGKMNE